MSKTSAGVAVPSLADLQTGLLGLKMKTAAEEEIAVVDARKALFIKHALDVFFVVYLLVYVGVVALMVMVSDNWWDPWPGVVFVSPICMGTLWLTPKMKEVYIQLYAKKKGLDTDLINKRQGSEK
ncbi:hypothetical protein BS78_08G167800 [Paspalum vaginatum]|nr:hypothetical protein BS78_08G167800 [Paspalum vaginatum]